MSAESDEGMPVWAVRLEGKVDAVLGLHEQRLDAQEERHVDHEARLRALESRTVVTPRHLWTALGGTLAAVGALGQAYSSFHR